MKICTCCKKTLPLSAFNKKSDSPDGLSYYCKECAKKKNNHYYNYKNLKPSSIRPKNENRKPLRYTDIKVEEGKQFKTAKDFLKFKRDRIQKQKDAL